MFTNLGTIEFCFSVFSLFWILGNEYDVVKSCILDFTMNEFVFPD